MITLSASHFVKVSAGALLIFLFCGNIQPAWLQNGSGKAFCCADTERPDTEYYVVQGAQQFLDSYSNLLMFMQKTESGAAENINTDDAGFYLAKALENMKAANDTYFKLKTIAAQTPYNLIVIYRLKSFDYDGFYNSNLKNLNSQIFSDAKTYLLKGDVRGIYAKMYANTSELIDAVSGMITAYESGSIQPLSQTWRANYLFSGTLLFGQFVAEVFNNIDAK